MLSPILIPLVTSTIPADLKPVSMSTKTPIPSFTTITFLALASGMMALVGTMMAFPPELLSNNTFTNVPGFIDEPFNTARTFKFLVVAFN